MTLPGPSKTIHVQPDREPVQVPEPPREVPEPREQPVPEREPVPAGA